MNQYARRVFGAAISEMGRDVFQYHPKKSHQKVEAILKRANLSQQERPVAMIVDVLNKVLMINVSRIEMSVPDEAPMFAMTFIDVTQQTDAVFNPQSGLIELKKLPVCEREGFLFIDIDDIYFIQSDGNYCKIFTKDASYYIHITLKEILKRYAGSNLLRVHKSYVVNLNNIYKIQRDSNRHYLIHFNANIPPVPVARRRLNHLKKALELRIKPVIKAK